MDISSLTYFCTARKDGAEGTCKLRQLPQEAKSIQRWLAKLHLGDDYEYKGEGLPGITQRVFCQLLRAERRSPAQAERHRVIQEQDHRCNLWRHL